MNLTWRTLKNSIYGMAEYLWPILLALFATPYVVNSLGVETYGVFAIVGVTMSFFGFLDLGLGAAATKQIATFYEAEQHEGINGVISTTAIFYGAIGMVAGLVIAALAYPLAYNMLTIPAPLRGTAQVAFYISAIAFPISLVTGTFGAIPRALQRFDISTKISLVFGTLSTLVTVGIVGLGGGVLQIMAAGLLLGIISAAVYWRVSKRLLPTLRLQPRIDRAMLRELLSFGFLYFLSNISVVLLYQLDKLMLGALAGVAAVTYYVVPGNLAQRIQGLVGAAVLVAFPVSASLIAAGDTEGVLRLYRRGSHLVFILVASVSVPLAVFSHPFLEYWMGADIAANSSAAMVLLVGTYAVIASGSMAWSIANGAGRAGMNASFAFFMAIVDVTLLYILVGSMGVTGAALAYLVAACLGIPPLIWLVERRILAISGWEFLRIGWRIVLVAAIQASLALFLRQAAQSLWLTLALMGISFVSFYALYFMFGFVRPEDRRLLELVVGRLRGGPTAIQ